MTALLLKDFYTILRQGRLMLVFVLVFALIPGLNAAGLAIVYAAMLPYTALAYDERSKWDAYAVMLPYSRTTLVSEKYLLGWVATGVAALLSLAGGILLGTDPMEALVTTLSVAGVALLMLAVSLPFMIRYGVEKGRMLFLAFFFLIVMGMLFLENLTSEGAALPESVVLGLLGVALPVLGLVAQPVSLLVARPLYFRAHCT